MNTAKTSIRLFVDFDGTATHRDVGNGIFDRFLRPDLIARNWHKEIIDEWKAERISSFDCLKQECANSCATEEEMREELDRYALTPGFVETACHCRKNGIPLMILSDGLDYYIEFILGKYGLSFVDYRANHMYFNGGSLGVDFPYHASGCGKCANCKRSHMDASRTDGETVVYVGDGYSDRYAIKSADVIFARRDLAEYCTLEGIDFHPFETFYDVLDYVKTQDGREDV